MEDENNEKQKRNIGKWIKIVLIILISIILVVAIFVTKFINDKLSKINFQELDEENLGINENLYDELEGITKEEYKEVINILLLGSDSKDMSNQYAGNSDAIMIISINPNYKTIKLISIPRDTAANIEGFEYRYKINAAFREGREQLAIKTINENFGLNLREYVTINISEMYGIINELGGVELEITKEEMNWINQYVDMFYEFSGNLVKKVTTYGKVTLTGEQAAAHVKERMAGFSNEMEEHGDYGRTRRQRDVFISMLNKIMSKDPAEISRIIDLVLLQITTNIDLAKYMPLIPEFIANKNMYLDNIISVMIPKVDYSKEILERGAYIYVTDIEKAKRDFIKYMYEM